MQHEKIKVIEADYQNPNHRKHLANALIAYATDPMGGGKALSNNQAQNSVTLLTEKNYTFSFLAFYENTCVGFANCVESISTFSAACIVNIHDFAVLPDYRGLNISQSLLTAIETYAKKHHYQKITLEVLEGNTIAQKAYRKFGFEAYQLDPEAGQALFWQKQLVLN